MQNTATIDIRGGLGNQLFQIFTLLSLCYDSGRQPILPSEKLQIETPPRKMYWEGMLNNLKPYVAVSSDFSGENAIEYCETDVNYAPFPLFSPEKPLMLRGQFMSHMYFSRWRDRICSEIGFSAMQYKLHKTYPFIFTELGVRKVSVHFRLGDYTYKQCYHPVMPVSYYVDAITQMMRENTDPSIKRWVFYCFYEREHEPDINMRISQLYAAISPEYTFEIRKVPPEMTDEDDIIFMSMCDDNIMANSTFSWWGAYLNNNPSKRVIYPSLWYGHQLYYLESGDMFPLTWCKLEVKDLPTCDCLQKYLEQQQQQLQQK